MFLNAANTRTKRIGISKLLFCWYFDPGTGDLSLLSGRKNNRVAYPHCIISLCHSVVHLWVLCSVSYAHDLLFHVLFFSQRTVFRSVLCGTETF